ncbi:hypothetical protein [Vibrio coralliilyticus]|uniref:Uncharacterized protein n=1 Tax=Vibrio coralliilyticus TaxID=190893 RepID=A0AAP6ZV80_9VIBR|nr:hypothetical protein [Vibrio coralliilyticus]NOI31805.1 hypothetical protein [Vibrio coralliilyticus]NOJ25248.1 hypothetical protein [Vibrio coralliilyticus]
MTNKKYRFSAVQKEILLRLAHSFVRDIKKAKSTVLNQAVNKMLDKEVHPNNFRASCETLESRGLIMRRKEGFDWYLNITPEGYEQAVEWMDNE